MNFISEKLWNVGPQQSYFLVKIFERQTINPISQGDIVWGQTISLNIFRPAKLDIQDVETRTEAEHQGFVLQHCTLRNNSFCR